MPKHTADEIRAGVKLLVADVTERKPEEISDTESFADDLGLDSLRALELMVAMGKKYKINIPEEEFKNIGNVNQAVSAVQRYM